MKPKDYPWLKEARKKAQIANRKRRQKNLNRFLPILQKYKDEGCTYEEIAFHMNNQQIKTANNCLWCANTVHRYLKLKTKQGE